MDGRGVAERSREPLSEGSAATEEHGSDALRVEAREIARVGDEAARGAARPHAFKPLQGGLGQCAALLEGAVALEINERCCGDRPEDAVDASGVEAELGEEHLHLGDVITALVRTRQIQQSLAESPTGFIQASEGRGVDLAGYR